MEQIGYFTAQALSLDEAVTEVNTWLAENTAARVLKVDETRDDDWVCWLTCWYVYTVIEAPALAV